MILTITTLHEFVDYGRDINNLPKRMAGLKTGKGSIEAGVYFLLSFSKSESICFQIICTLIFIPHFSLKTFSFQKIIHTFAG